MKGRVVAVTPSSESQYPPPGAVDTIYPLVNGTYAFVPDDDAHLPPDCRREDFGYYVLEADAIEVLEQ